MRRKVKAGDVLEFTAGYEVGNRFMIIRREQRPGRYLSRVVRVCPPPSGRIAAKYSEGDTYSISVYENGVLRCEWKLVEDDFDYWVADVRRKAGVSNDNHGGRSGRRQRAKGKQP